MALNPEIILQCWKIWHVQDICKHLAIFKNVVLTLRVDLVAS